MKKSPDCAKLMCWNLLRIILNGSVGHYSKCCIKTGKLKKLPNTWKQHTAGAHEPEDMYYNEDGNV